MSENTAAEETWPPFIEAEGQKLSSAFSPVEPSRHLHNIKTMKIRPDDVIICAFAKSGTHWTFEVCSMLLAGQAQCNKNAKVNFMLEFIDIPDIDAVPSPRVLNSHLAFRFLPWKLREQGARVIYVDRNPKDVSVSLYNHVRCSLPPIGFRGSFQQWQDAFSQPGLFGQTWFEYVQDWEKVMDVIKDLNLIWLHYEDMKEDLLREVRKLNAFLGTGCSEALMSEIAAACQFQRMKEAGRQKEWHHDGFFTEEFRANNGILRKGVVGDWKNHYTPEMDEKFDKLYAEEMKHSRLTFRYTL